ncbi:DNA mismatch repair endonuclease MutL [Vagococcus jeotgali]|uniref:DNA mismatch repair endonuclease MutL n=1 Tax=Vagococcus jeotgali TaxID=3109030 RepID=UPI002DDBCC85|nr:DNA mismatch repair endonuclease MutL [Vagococcus sp. B2T-5]
MAKIEELSQILANQIAAGEVVERPASVVKELIENAIDANSTQIDIFIEEAGLKTIQVIDNGDGIESDDVLNAFKRHATSKIHNREDLFRIRSLGFRGEALPSIASVSEVTLETSTGEEGSFVFLSGGELKEQKPHSLRKGTNLTVSQLFFNTPARLKYVKTLQTETSNVIDVVNRLAMSHPSIAFRLVHDGNQLLKTLGNGDLKQAIAGVYGVATAKKMMQVTGDDLDFKLVGYVSLPEVTRASRNYISIMINGRYIKNFALNKSIVEGYGSKLMVGRFPIAVLSIEMDPLLVDVNVHPTKQEVRLSKEKELVELIKRSISRALGEEVLIPRVNDTKPFRREVESESTLEQTSLSFHSTKEKLTPKIKETNLAYDSKTGDFYLKNEEQVSPSFVEKPQEDSDSLKPFTVHEDIRLASEIDQTVHSLKDVPVIEADQLEPIEEDIPSHEFPDLEYFGQMHGTYLFAQSREGLYIIDQHAAQERIKYEYFRKKIGEVTDDLQQLLVPIVLEFPKDEYFRIKENIAVFEEVGIELEDFGKQSFIVRSHPTWYEPNQEEAAIHEMIAIFLEEGRVDVAKFREDTAIMMSCKQSIKANHHLNDIQARSLLEELKLCDNPFNCPHGRPVLIHFNNQDMEKLFKRIQDPH